MSILFQGLPNVKKAVSLFYKYLKGPRTPYVNIALNYVYTLYKLTF